MTTPTDRSRRPFSELIAWEFERNRTRVVIAAALVLAIDGYAMLRFGARLDDQGARRLLFFFAVTFLAQYGLAVMFAFETLRSEWSANTNYLLFSLPVRGATVLGAKVLVILAHVTALSVLAVGLAWWYVARQATAVPPPPQWWLALSEYGARIPLQMKMAAAAAWVLGALTLAVITVCAFVAGQAWSRWRWSVLLVVLIGLPGISSAFYEAAGNALAGVVPSLTWNPAGTPFGHCAHIDFGFRVPAFWDGYAALVCDASRPPMPVVMKLGGLAGGTALAVALFAASAALWDRRVRI